MVLGYVINLHLYILIEMYRLFYPEYWDTVVYSEEESNVLYIENGGGKVFRNDDNIFPDYTIYSILS
jgi:hypothetical protein